MPFWQRLFSFQRAQFDIIWSSVSKISVPSDNTLKRKRTRSQRNLALLVHVVCSSDEMSCCFNEHHGIRVEGLDTERPRLVRVTPRVDKAPLIMKEKIWPVDHRERIGDFRTYDGVVHQTATGIEIPMHEPCSALEDGFRRRAQPTKHETHRVTSFDPPGVLRLPRETFLFEDDTPYQPRIKLKDPRLELGVYCDPIPVSNARKIPVYRRRQRCPIETEGTSIICEQVRVKLGDMICTETPKLDQFATNARMQGTGTTQHADSLEAIEFSSGKIAW